MEIKISPRLEKEMEMRAKIKQIPLNDYISGILEKHVGIIDPAKRYSIQQAAAYSGVPYDKFRYYVGKLGVNAVPKKPESANRSQYVMCVLGADIYVVMREWEKQCRIDDAEMEKCYNSKQVMNLLGVQSTQTLAIWARKGLIKGKKIRSRWWYDKDAVRELARQRVKEAEEAVKRLDEVVNSL